MPTYMIGTYNEDDTVDVMMMAWGGICAEDMVALNLEEDHKTVVNLKARKAFTLAVPGTDTIKESDYLGTASAKKFPDKFAKTGLHAEKSSRVDAPVITEYPLTLECEVVEMQQQPYGLRVLGKIVNVLADEAVLDEMGRVDAGKLNAFRQAVGLPQQGTIVSKVDMFGNRYPLEDALKLFGAMAGKGAQAIK